MNNVILIGRLTKDIDLRYTGSEKAVAKFALAVDDGYGEGKKVYFPQVVAWEKTAENLAAYCGKGSQIAVEGKLTTGSYEKDGRTVYTTEVVARNIHFLSGKRVDNQVDNQTPELDDDVPF